MWVGLRTAVLCACVYVSLGVNMCAYVCVSPSLSLCAYLRHDLFRTPGSSFLSEAGSQQAPVLL